MTNTPPTARTRVLHVSEAYGGGLASAVQEYVSSTPQCEHILAFSGRDEAPVSNDDLACFDEVVELGSGPLQPMRTIRHLVAHDRIDVVHAHSAFGGAYARLAVRRRRVPIIYTPHCYAFLRGNRGWLWLSIFWWIERLLAFNTTLFAGCSPHEHRHSRWSGSRSAAIYVPNAYSGTPDHLTLPEDHPGTSVHLLGVGRLLKQKDPLFFAHSVEALRAAGFEVEATWVGDGDHRLRVRLEEAGVKVRGWVERAESRRSFAGTNTIYLHSARWEGFPFGILEAHAAATPVIVRRIRTLADFDFPHQVDRPLDVVEAVRAIAQPGGRADAVRRMDETLSENTPAVQQKRLGEAYALALEPSIREAVHGRR